MGRPKGSKNKTKREEGQRVPQTLSFHVHLKAGGNVYEAEGVTLNECFDNIQKSKPIIYKSGIIRMTYNGKTIERIIPPLQMRRLFMEYGSLTRTIYREQWAKLFKSF